METRYKSGRKHLNADWFSRNPSLPENVSPGIISINILDWSSIGEEQRQDLRLRSIFAKLHAFDHAMWDPYALVNGILCKRSFNP